jgi:phosphoglucosamine mutase
MLQAALTAGLSSEGCGVIDLGVLPTPGVAWTSAADRLPAAMISASHNPFADNGIKFFAPGGRKLSDDVEESLEAELDAVVAGRSAGTLAVGDALGAVVAADGGRRYADGLEGLFQPRHLAGLTVILDCANGAASTVASGVFSALGARVGVMNDQPDGININAGCGSNHPEALAKEVVEAGADVGLAFDGDADRVIAVDHTGAIVDGDQIIVLCALDRRIRGKLAGDTVVVTVMANLGLRQAMSARGIQIVETAVGDRYVLEKMEAGGFSLGGEQSGHVIFRDLATTGDGILTGLQVLDVMVRSGRRLADLAAVMTRHPQVLRNVPVGSSRSLDDASEIWDEVRAAEERLGRDGRVLVRASGTEPVVRVMVEAVTLEDAEQTCAALCAAVANWGR